MKTWFLNYIGVKLPQKPRTWLITFGGVNIGKSFNGLKDAYFDYCSNSITIGDNVYINRLCKFFVGFDRAKVSIDNNCDIGPNVTFICVGHEIASTEKRAGRHTYGSISIGKGTWIGANVTILPNTKIGEGVIIAAGSVVRGIIDDNSLYAGVPAKKIKQL